MLNTREAALLLKDVSGTMISFRTNEHIFLIL